MRHPGFTGPGEQEERASQWGCSTGNTEQPQDGTNHRWAPEDQRVREDCGGASTPLLWELSGEGSHRPGLTSVPAAHSDPLLEPKTNWNGKSVTLSYFPVVFKHNELEPSGLWKEWWICAGGASWQGGIAVGRWPEQEAERPCLLL